MGLDALTTAHVIEILGNYIDTHHPPEDIRDKLDLDYRIDNQSVHLFEIRPKWNNPSQKMHEDFAKATYVKKSDSWKIFWLRSNLKWCLYDPMPEVGALQEFVDLVSDDIYGCFRG